MKSYGICLLLTYFTQHNTFNVCLCCHKCHDFTLFNSGVIHHCVCVYVLHIFLVNSSINGNLSCIHIMAIVNSISYNLRVQLFLLVCDVSVENWLIVYCSVTQLCPTLCDSLCHKDKKMSLTISQTLLKLMSIESVMPSNHLVLCYPLLLLPSIFLSIRVFSKVLALRISWPKYWSFSFSFSPTNKYSGLMSFRID